MEAVRRIDVRGSFVAERRLAHTSRFRHDPSPTAPKVLLLHSVTATGAMASPSSGGLPATARNANGGLGMTDDRVGVLLLIKGLGGGGAERLLVNSLPHLDRERFNYSVAYLLPWKDDLVAPFEEHGIDVSCLDAGNIPRPAVVTRLSRLMTEKQIAVLDVHLPYSGLIGRLAARRAKTPVVVYTEHVLSVQRRLERARFLSFISNVATYPMNDLIVAVSRDTLRDVERFNWSRTPTRLIYNGIPLEDFDVESDRGIGWRAQVGIGPEKTVIGHIAKMVSKKDQRTLLDAVRKVVDDHPEVVLVVVGEGDLRDELEAYTAELGLTDQVVFTGFIDDPRAALAGFDLFALSSLHEGLPTVVIEAMASGVPVVATDVGGTGEIVTDGDDGILVPAGDPDALAGAISELVVDVERRKEMGRRASESVRRRFDIARRVHEMEAVYDELLTPSAGAPSRR